MIKCKGNLTKSSSFTVDFDDRIEDRKHSIEDLLS